MADLTVMDSVVEIPVESLVPSPLNPFSLYTGQRFNDMVESIQANGVLVPIIVRPIPGDEDSFEILSGHNRVAASKAAARETVPAIIGYDLSDEEALLVTVETNMLQRSYTELSHSERATVLSVHYDAIKAQGRRTDLIKEVEELLSGAKDGQSIVFDPSENKLKSIERVGQEYGLSKNTVARYLCIARLIKPLSERLDNALLSFRAAVSLSYLTEDEQEIINEILVSGGYKISMAQAEQLRHVKRPLTREAVLEVIGINDNPKPAAVSIKIKPQLFSKYFRPGQKRKEIEEIIEKALERYFNN